MSKEDLKKNALAFLREHTTAVLATSSLSGEPQAAALYYDVDDDFNFYFISSKESQKAKNLMVNKRASIVVGFGAGVSTIQGAGDVEITETIDFQLFTRIVARIKLKEASQLALSHVIKSGFVTIKVTPRWLTWLNLDKETYPETYSKDFQSLL